MKKVDKEVLLEASQKMLFGMSDSEFDTLLEDFNIITKQMELINQIDGIDVVSPMTFPYPCYGFLREDVAEKPLSQEETLKNAGEVKDKMISLPKVVG